VGAGQSRGPGADSGGCGSPAIKPVPLDAKAIASFEQLRKATAAASRLRRAEKRAREARKTLDAAFGDAFLGVGPDDQLIQRSPHSIDYEPLPAKTVEWNDYQEIAPWDA
jgi:hypothetical protein